MDVCMALTRTPGGVCVGGGALGVQQLKMSVVIVSVTF